MSKENNAGKCLECSCQDKSGESDAASQQFCEVLGKELCHHCLKVYRQASRIRNCHERIYYSILEDDSLISSLVASNLYTIDEKQSRRAENKVTRSSFQKKLIRMTQKDDDSSEEIPPGCESSSTFQRSSLHYFANISDLNKKLITGKGYFKEDHSDNKTQDINLKRSSGESKLSSHINFNKPDFVALYEPCLLPKVCQNTKPKFFAGINVPYQLPDRLPEDIFQDEML